MNRTMIILGVISILLAILSGVLWFTLRDTEQRAKNEVAKLSGNLVTAQTT